MKSKLTAQYINLAPSLGFIKIEMNPWTMCLKLVENRTVNFVYHLIIVFTFFRGVSLYYMSYRIIIGDTHVSITLSDIILLLFITFWFTFSFGLYLVDYFRAKEMIHFYNQLLILQTEVEKKWPSKFDASWRTMEFMIRFCLWSSLPNWIFISGGFMIEYNKPFQLYFWLNENFPWWLNLVVRLTVPILDSYLLLASYGVGIPWFYFSLTYYTVTNAGLKLLRDDSSCNPGTMALYRKYQLLNGIYNKYFATTYVPVFWILIGISWTFLACIVIGTQKTMDPKIHLAWLACLIGFSFSVSLFIITAASLNLRSKAILDDWSKVGKNKESRAVHVKKANMLIQKCIRSLSPIGVHVHQFFLTQKSSAINYFRILTDNTITILLAMK